MAGMLRGFRGARNGVLRFTNYQFWLGPLLRALAVAGALMLSRWASLPWLATCGVSLLGGGALAAAMGNQRVRSGSLIVIWVATVLIPAGLVLGAAKDFPLESYLDLYYGVLAWLLAAALWPGLTVRGERRFSGSPKVALRTEVRDEVELVPAGRGVPEQLRTGCCGGAKGVELGWQLPALTWVAIGTLIWLTAAYLQNLRGPFYAGLAVTIGLMTLCLVWFRLPLLIMQAEITVMLLCIGLPVVEWLVHPPQRVPNNPEQLKQYSSYSAAREHPAGFEAWWRYFWDQWLGLAAKVLVYEPQAPVPLRLRPNSEGMLVESPVRINSRGFRGPEIPLEKRGAYRIVALGESTTFGFTINAADRPWPELLQELIRERLRPTRSVEVINAGLPSADLAANLLRFPGQILPLQPDLIVCYHGFNGFHGLDPALPRATGKALPAYRKRPLRLLADCEYRAKLLLYRRAHTAGLSARAPTFANLMETDFARAYRDLIQIAQTNQIRLVLAEFSMAANEASPPELVEFFRPRTPAPHHVIKANAAHSRMVRRLAEEHPAITLVDTRPHLDGEPDQFIDIIHFSHSGEVQMAENVFEGIKALLEQELGARKP